MTGRSSRASCPTGFSRRSTAWPWSRASSGATPTSSSGRGATSRRATARRTRCSTRSKVSWSMSIEPPAYDEVAERYHRVFDPDGSRLRDPIFEDLLGDVAGEEVLALACGQGRDARLLADLGATVVGVDVSEQMLSYARRF